MSARSSTSSDMPRGLRAERRNKAAALRDQILDAAEAIAADGVEALSMRRLAQALDCAPMTLYSYFRDKHALLLALANRRFDLLAQSLAEPANEPPLAALRRLHILYAGFGLKNPDAYRTIFMTPELQPARDPKTSADIYGENPAFALGVDRARACVSAGELAGDPHAIATLLWTSVHGAVAALLTFPAFPFGDPDAYAARAVDIAIAAVQHAPAAALCSPEPSS